MKTINYSEEEQNLLKRFENLFRDRKPPVISMSALGKEIKNWSDKPNYREPSFEESYTKAAEKLAFCGDLSSNSSDAYTCAYTTRATLRELGKQRQGSEVVLSSEEKPKTRKLDEFNRVDKAITVSAAFKDQSLDDDDDLDFEEIIKFRKELYDESESSDFEKKEVVDTDKIIVELDKLLKEVIDERGVTSTEESTRFIERDFIFVDEIQSKCEYLILKIVASDIKQDRQGAINIAQAVLDKAKIKAGENREDTIVTICEYVVEEFNDCSDEDYSKLKNDVWG